MPAKSVKQRRFMGMVRAVQKGEMEAPSPEIAAAAKDMGAEAVKKFAKTKEKNLPMKKEEVEHLEEMPYQVYGSPDGKKEKKIGKPVKSKKYADARAAELADTHKATGGKYRSEYTEETIVERGDYWHPDPEKDRKLGGPGANQRAREDRAAASKPKEDPKKLRPGESYMDYAKRQKGGTAAPKKKEGLRDKLKRKLGLKEEAPTMNTGSTTGAAGFSSDADENGPTAGMDQPLGGTTRLRGKGASPKKRKFKCRKSADGVNQVCGG